MPTVAAVKEQKRAMIDRHVRRSDVMGLAQAFTTLVPLGLLWTWIGLAGDASFAVAAAVVLPMSLFLLRAFVLMHECGHGSLFQTDLLNKVFGFVFGVVCGMPQYVWSRHHHHHHSTNGNWSRYGGPLDIVPVDVYAAMSEQEQRGYRHARNIWLAPVAGFLYLVLNPRLNWLKGCAGLIGHVVRGKLAQPGEPIRAMADRYETRHWSTATEFRHMLGNNMVLLALWVALAWTLGPVLFFAVYVASLSLAGGAGILLFTVQHNFDASYATGDDGWDYDAAALHGTSFLVLPAWLNWFTVNIAYHHVHHLSARIPNYRLVRCHDENRHLFVDVRRISLRGIPAALKCILWDTATRRIVPVVAPAQRPT